MRVLIAIDDSECSAKALDSVLEQTWPPESEFRLITIVEPVYSYAYTGANMAPLYESQQEFEKECREMIDEKIAQLQKRFADAKVSGDVIEGIIAGSIVEEAKAWSADLIVLGSHGRRGFQKFLLGSIAEKVAGLSPCSVEIVKPKSKSETERANPKQKKSA
jgi:nucleotide-binding universal stress UspA family protein